MLNHIIRYRQMRHSRLSSWPTTVALSLIMLLSACGGSTPASDAGTMAPVVQKGFGPTQLYHPTANPTGRVLQQGDTGIVFLPQAGSAGPAEQQVWFEIASASPYTFEMEDEDLAILARVDVADAAGRALLSVDANQRIASATLTPGRYALRLIASPTNPETTPLFIRFEDGPAQLDQQGEAGKWVARADFEPPQPRPAFSRDCVGCQLAGAFLNGEKLNGANLAKANLEGVTLTDVELRGANLSGAKLSKAKLRFANLQEANLGGAELFRVELFGANLAAANLSGANLIEANLMVASLSGANLSGANLSRAFLSSANLTRAILPSANLRGAFLPSANLSMANLTGANLTSANLTEANLNGLDLSGADLSGAVWADGRQCATNSVGVCQ